MPDDRSARAGGSVTGPRQYGPTIEDYFTEDRRFPPPAGFAARRRS